MIASTLDDSMIRLEGIKENKQKYNKTKIAEAEALAAEALRMANEAKQAAARLAEVKKTLSRFSKKLENVEVPVEKEAKPKSIEIVSIETEEKKPIESPVVVENAVKQNEEEYEEAIVQSDSGAIAVVEEESKPTAVEHTPFVQKQEETGFVSQNLICDDVVKVVETGNQRASRDATPKPEVTDSTIMPTDSEPMKDANPDSTEESDRADPEPMKDSNQVPAPTPEVKENTSASEAKEPAHVTEQPTPVPAPASPVFAVKHPTPDAPSRRHDPVAVYQSHNWAAVRAVQPVQDQVQTNTPVVVQQDNKVVQQDNKDVIEDFLDSLGIDRMCGVDDETLGFTDRPVLPPSPPPPQPQPVFKNPTRVEIQNRLEPNDIIHSTSWKERVAITQRKERNLEPKTYQRSPVNVDFADPFGVDHDDLVTCGRLADLCEPPDYEIEYHYENAAPREYNLQSEFNRKNVSFSQ